MVEAVLIKICGIPTGMSINQSTNQSFANCQHQMLAFNLDFGLLISVDKSCKSLATCSCLIIVRAAVGLPI